MLWSFAEFEIDTDTFELRRAGSPVPIQRKPLLVLVHLMEHAGRVVPASELMNAVWHGTNVTPASVRTAVKLLRDALADHERRIVGVAPGYGYRFLARACQSHVSRAEAPPSMFEAIETPSRRVVSSASGFIGRESELGTLCRAFEAACGGRTEFVALQGPCGVGKTRLLREFGDFARHRGARVVWGQCWDQGAMPPLWPWGDLFSKIESFESTLEPRQVADWSELIGRESMRFGAEQARTPASASSPQQLFALFRQAAEFVRCAARDRTVVLILDDLHEAQEPAQLLLEFVVRSVQEVRLLVVVAFRESRRTVTDSRIATLARLLTRARTLVLDPLDRREQALLVQALLGARPSPRLLNQIQERTGGNPFYVEHATLALARRLNEGTDRADPAQPDWEIPISIRHTILREVASLPARLQEFLRVAAVVGREIPLLIVGDVMGTTESEVLGLSDDAVLQGILVSHAPTHARFTHSLIRDVLYTDLATSQRLSLRQRIARALEQRGVDANEHALAQVTHHLSKAAPHLEPGRTMDYVTRTGTQPHNDSPTRRLATSISPRSTRSNRSLS